MVNRSPASQARDLLATHLTSAITGVARYKSSRHTTVCTDIDFCRFRPGTGAQGPSAECMSDPCSSLVKANTLPNPTERFLLNSASLPRGLHLLSVHHQCFYRGLTPRCPVETGPLSGHSAQETCHSDSLPSEKMAPNLTTSGVLPTNELDLLFKMKRMV